MRDSPWIQTFRGGKFHLFDPRPEEVFIEDIAHALSLTCRFSGHINEFYSVAQHSYLTSLRVPPEDALWGLLHDAAESFVGDLSRPLKHHPSMAEYVEVEANILRVIANRFGLPEHVPDSVKKVDRTMLLTERRDLLKPLEWTSEEHTHWDLDNADKLYEKIIPMSPKEAKLNFLYQFSYLTQGAAQTKNLGAL